MRKSSSNEAQVRPVDVRVSFKPFPWPAVTEDLGAASAGVLFNLLLVRGRKRGAVQLAAGKSL